MYGILYVQMFQGYLSVNDFANAVDMRSSLTRYVSRLNIVPR